MTVVPVVFLHVGDQDYFLTAINIASRKNIVHVLGDQTEGFKSKVQQKDRVFFHSIIDYKESSKNFRNVYQHLHKGEIEAQLICYDRWYVIKDLMAKLNLSVIFHADSDLAVLCDTNSDYQAKNSPEFALMTQSSQPEYRLVASAHGSYWTFDAMQKLCDFMIRSYADRRIFSKLYNKFDYHQRANWDGGVCDMTQLYLFSQLYPHVSLSKATEELEPSCFDDNLNFSENYDPDEYQMEHGYKKMIFDKDRIFFVNKQGNRVLANTIHCQGGAKHMLGRIEYYLKRNTSK